jgi:vacuolar-type H+-ATPase subunit H
MLQQSYHQPLVDNTTSLDRADLPQLRSPQSNAPGQIEASEIGLESPNIFKAIDRLEERILNSPRVPLTGKVMVDEEVLLEQLDAMRLSLPEVVTTAREILEYRHQIVREAQQHAQQILDDANRRAEQIANELGIIERAEQEARQIGQMALTECDRLRHQAVAEIQHLHDCHAQELGQMRQEVIAECDRVQAGADEYADRVLHNMEYQLKDMLQSIQRGRQCLTRDAETLRIVAPAPEIETNSLSDRLKEIGNSCRISRTSSPSPAEIE